MYYKTYVTIYFPEDFDVNFLIIENILVLYNNYF